MVAEIKALKAMVKFDDFAKLDLRVARILEAREHGNADKLLVLKIDLGFEERQICAALKTHYQPEELVGRSIVVLANLEARTMRGELSQGMLLSAAEGPAKLQVVLLEPAVDLAPGSVVA